MSAVPPPYQPRDQAQVQPPLFQPTASQLEFSETTSVTLEWRLTGLRHMYDSTKGEAKSKCVKSAVFGDADNLWEVLWYPNSGVANGEYASLYLSCLPTAQEKEQGSVGKWSRRGLWWFRFEIRSTVPDERTGKLHTLAAKDASDHMFANKTANWGWQQFSRRDTLFQHPTVLAADSFVIVCTIQAQAQPPAGYWLGVGLPPSQWTPGVTTVGNKQVGSGGGLSAWAGGEGASGGVAGGTVAGGGPKRVVPRELVSVVGALLDDPLYSDIEFIIQPFGSRKRGMDVGGDRPMPRRIYANKRMLDRCDYFHAMFNGGFKEVEGIVDEDDDEEDLDALSDSDAEEEAADLYPSLLASSSKRTLSPSAGTTSNASPIRKNSASADRSTDDDGDRSTDDEETRTEYGAGTSTGDGEEMGDEEKADGEGVERAGGGATSGPSGGRRLGGGSGSISGTVATGASQQREVGTTRPDVTRDAAAVGPKKTKIVVRDAAWSTWWAILFWLYTDIIYFAPLTSTFTHPPLPASRGQQPPSVTNPGASGSGAGTGAGGAGGTGAPPALPPQFHSGSTAAETARSRTDWIRQWMDEHAIAFSPSSTSGDPLGPRPVSAKAVYRLADKLDLPALKLRAFQHIIGQLTAQNVPAEVFSRFSSTFEDVRKVQVAYFLKHWSEIKKSETMMQIWQQIRHGKHVGFEEVWPLIVGQLDFKPSS